MARPTLDPEEVVETLETLVRRIRERFPRAHLAKFTGDLLKVGRGAQRRAVRLNRPIPRLRLAIWTVLVGLLVMFVYGVWAVLASFSTQAFGEPIQSVEAALSSVVFLGAAAVFLLTFESRVKRRRALRAIYELRALAHVIDMHQLAKDPKDEGQLLLDTASSPKHLDLYELTRYLDYCSELLAILNKIGALYVQDSDDPVALAAVDGLQRLVDGLSQKIWHKIAIADRMIASGRRA